MKIIRQAAEKEQDIPGNSRQENNIAKQTNKQKTSTEFLQR